MRARRSLGAVCLFGLLNWYSMAFAQASTAPNEEQREKLRQAVQALLISLAQDPSFQAMPESDWSLVYAQDSQAFANFGVIFNSAFDPETDARGLLVLAVTPNSTAAEMGVRIGDRIRGLNTRPLVGLGPGRGGQSRAYAQFAALLDGLMDGSSVTLEMERHGQMLQLQGSLERWNLPAVSLALSVRDRSDSRTEVRAELAEPQGDPCGTLSLHHSPPHRHDLYPAYLTSINDTGGGAAMRRFHYLSPGTYRLTLGEVIPERELRLRNTRETRRQPKEMQLQVEDGMVYHLGARLLHDRKQQKNHEEYWKPVVWRMEPGYCKGKPISR